LRKSTEWLYQLCRALFEERGLKPAVSPTWRIRPTA